MDQHSIQQKRYLFVALGGLCGSVIALISINLVLYAEFASGGYTLDALIELPTSVIWMVVGVGAVVGIVTVSVGGGCDLPKWVKGVAFGSLAAVATVVFLTLIVAHVLGGFGSKAQAHYVHLGLVYGVPIGIVVGSLSGVLATAASSWKGHQDKRGF